MIVQAKIVPDTGTSEKRREARIEAGTEMGLGKFGDGAVDARLVNISSRGFMAECSVPIEKGARVWLNLDGLRPIYARVIWSIDGRLGGEFTRPIDPLAVLQTIGKGRPRS